MLWARRQDPVSLRNMVELLASAGQAMGFAVKTKRMVTRGQGNKLRVDFPITVSVSVSITMNTANFSL